MEMTYRPLCYILLVKSKLFCLSYTQGEWILQLNTRGQERLEAILEALSPSCYLRPSPAENSWGLIPQGSSGEHVGPQSFCNPGQREREL